MFNYLKCPYIRERQNIKNSIKIFKPVKNGVILSDDFRAAATSFEDYAADNLVSAGVDVAETSREFVDVSLDSLDGVEEQVEKLVEKEFETIKQTKNN